MTTRSPLKLLTLAALLTALVLTGFGCKGGNKKAQEAAQPVALNWWLVDNSQANVQELLTDYDQLRPNVSVRVRVVRVEELEQLLTQALADNNAPDIVSLPNTWLRGWQHRLAPLPPALTLPYLEMAGVIKKEPRWVLKSVPSLDLRTIKGRFVDVVVEDAYLDEQIYGLPLSLDSLVVFYNIDLLTAAQFPQPPTTWDEFKETSMGITRLDKQGHLLQNGAALGTADNISYAFDIVSALMLQNNTPMVNSSDSRVAFHEPVEVAGQSYSPGMDALRFYTDFAQPTKETYSWSAEEPTAREAFAAGRLGFLMGYWRDLNTLKVMAPRVRIGVSNFPQIEGSLQPAYYADYYLETVMKQSQHQAEAWDLIQFITTPQEVEKYLRAAQRPTAQRQFISQQLEDIDLAVPAAQVLSAKSWY
ncbi:MAG: extracellular solute-binding protein, partial [Candidatus Veblenbacteria bacterium]|nr:extracellular solute-binding protein [Candidatus Veblenbacteria bacterium]